MDVNTLFNPVYPIGTVWSILEMNRDTIQKSLSDERKIFFTDLCERYWRDVNQAIKTLSPLATHTDDVEACLELERAIHTARLSYLLASEPENRQSYMALYNPVDRPLPDPVPYIPPIPLEDTSY
jgi:hypothetical protein